MHFATYLFATIGVLSAFITVFSFFSGKTDFSSFLQEVAVRIGISLSARPVEYYDTRMTLSIEGEVIVTTFLLPNSVEATFRIPTGSKKGILGSSCDTSHKLGFQNAQGTLFGFTSQPATKSGYPHLFFRNLNGQIILIDDINQKVAKMLPAPWNELALYFLRIESIQRRMIEFETVDFWNGPRQTLHFLVEVDSHGNLSYKNNLLSSRV